MTISRRAIALSFWMLCLVVAATAIILPVGNGITRLLIVLTLPALAVMTPFLFVRHKATRVGFLSALIAVLVFLFLPGRGFDPIHLQDTYRRQLLAYEGTAYVWGGENRRGIDCSGLVRRALIDAHWFLSLKTINPSHARRALDLWWHDCSAKALRDSYRQYTSKLFAAPSINSITNAALSAGDIAVTEDGVHVLAYIGSGKWIEADPGELEVIAIQTPTANPWFRVPVQVMRWAELERSQHAVGGER